MDLATSYLGLPLRNPLVASASPLSETLDGIRALADGGVGAIVLFSLFEEQLQREAAAAESLLAAGADSHPESSSYFPAPVHDTDSAARYLDLVERAVDAVDVPVIASLNGSSAGGWVEYARALEEAGASAIELNVYYVPGYAQTSGRHVEQRHVEILHAVKSVVRVPVAVKLSPFFSSPGEMARRLDAAGADGLVLFNRLLHAEIDPESLMAVPSMRLSTSAEGRLPRMWIALLRDQVACSLAATTGVEDAADVARCLLAGADVVMTASALIRNGPAYAGELISGLEDWLERLGFSSVDDARGRLRVPAGVDEEEYERAGYVAVIQAARRRYGRSLDTNHPRVMEETP